MKQSKDQEWEKEFDKKYLILKDFDGGDVSKEDIIRQETAELIKSFISDLLAKERERTE